MKQMVMIHHIGSERWKMVALRATDERMFSHDAIPFGRGRNKSKQPPGKRLVDLMQRLYRYFSANVWQSEA
jgi:hypothetical protein